MNENKPNPEAITHACPQCNAPVACGNLNGCESCWCANLPRVVTVPMPGEESEEIKCLCENCLRKRIGNIQKANTDL